jgi:hypothetical protein
VFQSVVSALNPRLEAVETSRRTLDQIGEDVGKIKKLPADVLAVLMKKIGEVVEKEMEKPIDTRNVGVKLDKVEELAQQ